MTANTIDATAEPVLALIFNVDVEIALAVVAANAAKVKAERAIVAAKKAADKAERIAANKKASAEYDAAQWAAVPADLRASLEAVIEAVWAEMTNECDPGGCYYTEVDGVWADYRGAAAGGEIEIGVRGAGAWISFGGEWCPCP